MGEGFEGQAVGDPARRPADEQRGVPSGAGAHLLARAADRATLDEHQHGRRDGDGDDRVARAEAAQAVLLEPAHQAVVARVGHQKRK